MINISKLIIERCRQNGYKLDKMNGNSSRADFWFRNPDVREELQMFEVVVDKDLESVKMAIIIDLGSWNEALETDLNDVEEVLNQIDLWISKDSLKEVESYFLEV